MSSRRLGAHVDHRHKIWCGRGAMTCGNYIDYEAGWQEWHRLVQISSLPYSVIISISQLIPQSLSICVLNLAQGGQSWLSVISKFPNRTGKCSPLYTKVIQTMILITLCPPWSYTSLRVSLICTQRERRRV